MADPFPPFKREITANASLLQVFPAMSTLAGAECRTARQAGACRAV